MVSEAINGPLVQSESATSSWRSAMRTSRWILSALVLFGVSAEPTAAADAADRYPSRPIRIVVGSTPGSTPDVLARLIGLKLGEAWRQAVVIENRAPSV